MDNSKPMSTPLASHFRLSSDLCPQSEIEREQMLHVPIQVRLVVIYMYTMVCIRPDMSHTVSVVSRYMSNPEKEQWQAVRWIFRYLKGTADIGLVFDKNKVSHSNVIGYVNFDYAGDLDKGRSFSGYIFTLCNSAVS